MDYLLFLLNGNVLVGPHGWLDKAECEHAHSGAAPLARHRSKQLAPESPEIFRHAGGMLDLRASGRVKVATNGLGSTEFPSSSRAIERKASGICSAGVEVEVFKGQPLPLPLKPPTFGRLTSTSPLKPPRSTPHNLSDDL
ncbi:hypothetical protein C8R44DRAFT_739402 [Mycena epipterygia]|nr:hypothetical protein C8R44DRAFT_739402 [Mycena epipterygia]